MFQFWKLHNIFTWEVAYLSCFIIQQKNFTSGLKSSKVKFWDSFPFKKAEGDHKVLVFGSNPSKFRNNGKYNSINNVKSIVNINVGNYFDVWFWCFRGRYSVIFGNMNSEFPLEWLIFSFDVMNLAYSSGRITKEYSWLSSYEIYLYAGKIFLVDRYWQKIEQMASHHFLIWRRLSPSRITEGIFLLNFDTCKYLSGDLRSDHLMILSQGCL